MEKLTKNPINRKAVLESMREGNRKALPFLLFPFVLTVIVLATPAFFIFRYLLLAGAPPLLRIFLGLLSVVPLCTPSVYFFARICTHFSERRMLRMGQIVWEKLPLLEKQERIVGRHTEYFFRFHGLREISVGSTAYQLAERGDEYYLLHFHGKRTIRHYYAAKTHELMDEQPKVKDSDLI